MEPSELDSATSNLGRRVMGSATALGTARLLQRGFDLIRILTIARWLGPEAMGVYAVAALAITALDQISETGFRPALIQYRGDISSYIVPVRTVQAARGLLLGLIFFLASPWVAAFFDSPNSLTILQVMALLPVVKGLEPLFITLAQKNLNFKPIVILQVIAAVTSLVVGIAAAYVRPDAWALVWSSFSGVVITTVGSSLLSHRRDLGLSVSWRPLKDIQNFGFWIFVIGISSYAFVRVGEWLIGHLLDVRELALYQMAFLICTTATQEIGGVISQLSFPVFSKLQSDNTRMQSSFRLSFGIIAIVTFAMAGLVCSCSQDLFALVLGDKWLTALALVPWLTVWGICAMFSGSLCGVFYALNRPNLWLLTVGVMTLLLLLGIYPMIRWQGALGAAILMTVIGVLAQLLRYRIVGSLLSLRYSQILRHLIVPGLACVISTVLTTWSRDLLPIGNPLAGLVFSTLFLCGTYVLVLTIGRSWVYPSFGEIVNLLKRLPRRSESESKLVVVEEIT